MKEPTNEEREWTVPCKVCGAKPGAECTSVVTGCVLVRGHHQRLRAEREANKSASKARN